MKRSIFPVLFFVLIVGLCACTEKAVSEQDTAGSRSIQEQNRDSISQTGKYSVYDSDALTGVLEQLCDQGTIPSALITQAEVRVCPIEGAGENAAANAVFLVCKMAEGTDLYVWMDKAFVDAVFLGSPSYENMIYSCPYDIIEY